MKKTKVNSLYIHIPFCQHLCDYCDFTKMFYLRPYVRKYIKELTKQIDNLGKAKFKTIYIGGGTPTSLSPDLLESLLSSLSAHKTNKTEFTIEVNLETMTHKKLMLMKKYGINRLSIGVQTFNDYLLKSINRYHNKRQIIYWINKFNKYEITNINIDLIYGLPNQTLEMFKKDIDIATSLNISHISSYSLTVSKGTVFFKKGVKEVSDEESRVYYDLLYKELKKKKFYRYEVSNFAKDKMYSRHNINYWNANEYVALGLGAHGYENGIRYQNTSNINEYLKGNYFISKEELSFVEQIEEFVMLNLRKEVGINKKKFKNRFNKDIYEVFTTSLKENVNNKLLKETKTHIKTAYLGMMLLDSVLIKMFLEL
ncbi:MAG: radical SAM family heme chaperone HemW [Erysipelotrichales bacterium]|nr:radical SAM family heme chaperone HemW [Erysipelotrichales bacterium]